jgi:hypothetical protein
MSGSSAPIAMPRLRTSNINPLIGIWWDDGRIIVAITEAPPAYASHVPLIDSELHHGDAWEQVAAQFGLSSHDDYREIPRGPVLRCRTGEGLILHGNGTSEMRRRAIAARFRLTSWTARRMQHYDTKPAEDELLEESFP